MNIYINGKFLSQSVSGVQRYAIELIYEMDRLLGKEFYDDRYKFILFYPKNRRYTLNLQCIEQRCVGFLSGHAWEQIELPLYAWNGFLLNLGNVAPLIKNRQIVTIHDAAVFACPQGFSFLFRTWYKLIYFVLSHKLKNIVTVSNFSKDELIRLCNFRKDCIHVIYSGIEHIFNSRPDEKILSKYKLKERPYVLVVASMNPNKNFKLIIEAAKLCKDEKFHFIVVGGSNSYVFADTLFEDSQHVKHIGYVSDEELAALYCNAACFIFPSLYEGFGFPPLEAMAHGCPVIVSPLASLPEICADSALYCDPYNPQELVEKVKLILENNAARDELIKKGDLRINHFSWKRCAESFLNIIFSIAKKSNK